MSFADSSFASAPFAAQVEDNVTVELTGVSSVIALQNLIISGDGSISVTAAEDQLDLVLGTAIAQAGAIVAVTGQGISFNTGAADITGTANVFPTGVDSAVNLGNATVAANADVPVTGIQANFTLANLGIIAWAEVNTNVTSDWREVITLPNVTNGLTLDDTLTAFTSFVAPPPIRINSVTFQTDSTGILLRSSYSEGEIWWELGGTGKGAYSGISKINNQYYIRFRSGRGNVDSQVQSDSSDFAVVDLDITNSSVSNFFNDQRHVVTWSIDVDNNKLLLWIDNTLVIDYDATANGGSVTEDGEWSGGNAGSYGQQFGAIAGETNTYDGGATQYQYSGPSDSIQAGSSFFQFNSTVINSTWTDVDTSVNNNWTEVNDRYVA